MNNVVSVIYMDYTLILANIDFSNHRKLTMIKIFISGNNNVKLLMEEDKIFIKFLIKDENIINHEILKIINYITNTVKLDLNISDSIKERIYVDEKKHDDFNRMKEQSIKIKSEDLSKDDGFKEFCDFCDKNLSIKLRPYQYKAAYYLTLSNGGFDFSVPGSGKTIIAYAAYSYLKNKGLVDSIVVIGPLSSYNAWYDEYITCFNKKPSFENISALKLNDAKNYLLSSNSYHEEIVFLNIEKTWRLSKNICKYMEEKNTLLIIDEGHKEKNPKARITKAVLEITKYAKSRIILTGTPMPNGYEDLYSLMNIYSPYDKILPYNYAKLRNLTKNGASENEEKNIMDSIKPFYSRVSKKYLLKIGELLEPKTELVSCDLSDEQQLIYDFLNKIAFSIDSNWESEYSMYLMKAVAIRKMQVSANPGLLMKSIVDSIEEYKEEYCEDYDIDDSSTDKLLLADAEIRKQLSESAIAQIINRFANGIYKVPKNEMAVSIVKKLVKENKKVILWETFVQNMYVLQNDIQKSTGKVVEIINGKVNGEERQNVINRFRNGNSNVLIANPATLAESISLHKVCQNAIYVNRNYNAAQFIQSKDRIHRINMPEGTTANYYFLINNKTIDESVNDRLDLKEKRMLRILDSDEIIIGGSELESNGFMSKEDIISSYRK